MNYLSIVGSMGVAAIVGLTPGALQAQDFPTDDIQFIVPYSAGGGQDRWARVIASGGYSEFGHPINVEVRPGASSTLGWNHLLEQPADGHTIMIGSMSPMIAILGEDGSPMEIDDIRMVAIVSDFNSYLIGKDGGDFTDWDAVSSYAAGNPGALTVGGTSGQILAAASAFAQAGLEVNLIPYPGTSEAVTDMLGGHIDLAVGTPATVTSLLGEASPILNLGARDNTEAQDAEMGSVPWVGDMGWTGVAQPRWIGVHPDTPDEVVARLDAGLAAILEDPSVARLVTSIGEMVIYSGAAEAQATYETLAEVISANIGLLK